MSIFNDKALKSVAEAAAKIMGEQLKGNQHKIDANKNGKIDAHDFKLLRGKKGVKEEIEQVDEAKKPTSQAEKDRVTAGVRAAMQKSHDNEMKGRADLAAAKAKAKELARGVKEEVEQLDEVGDTPAGRKALGSYVTKAIADKSKDRTKGLRKATSRMYKDNFYGKKNEEVETTEEQLDEAFPTVADAQKRMAAKESPFEKKKISTGTVYTRKHKEENDDDLKSPSRRARDSAAILGKGEHVAKKKKMSEMLAVYKDGGLKALNEMLVVEEPDNEQFTKELEDQKASMEGKKKQPAVAAPATKGVKEMPEETDVDPEDFISENEEEFSEEVKDDYARKVDKYLKKKYNKVSEETEQIEERELTKGEAKKKEEYVKGMKKGLSGFKQRYGERAKSVMYATATKMAKKD